MLLESGTLSVIAAKLRGGSFKKLEEVKFKAWYLLLLGMFVQNLPAYLRTVGLNEISEGVYKYFFGVHLLSYLLIFIALILNFSRRPVKVVFAGTLLNSIVIFINGGFMPVSKNALMAAGFKNIEQLGSKIDLKHILLTGETRFGILADIIPSPEKYPLHQILSIGDIFIAVGVFLFIQEAMLEKKSAF